MLYVLATLLLVTPTTIQILQHYNVGKWGVYKYWIDVVKTKNVSAQQSSPVNSYTLRSVQSCMLEFKSYFTKGICMQKELFGSKMVVFQKEFIKIVSGCIYLRSYGICEVQFISFKDVASPNQLPIAIIYCYGNKLECINVVKQILKFLQDGFCLFTAYIHHLIDAS